MSYTVHKYLSKEDSNLKQRVYLESFKDLQYCERINLPGKWSSSGCDVKAFTSKSNISNGCDIVKIKWYQDKKFLLFQETNAKQIEGDMLSKV